jgi:catechol 2,3-dioxygenase-like lactoylglutathione lyase family enzyme
MDISDKIARGEGAMSETTIERHSGAEAHSGIKGPPVLDSFAHVSVPCRDLEEGKRFYTQVLGGKIRVDTPTFAAIVVNGVEIGIGNEGCTFLEPGNEYPHFAFYCGPEALSQMKAWLARCGIPSSNFWTRKGVEVLMFFRDPSGNMIELFCQSGFKGAMDLPKGPPRGHGVAVDVEAFRYDTWALPV